MLPHQSLVTRRPFPVVGHRRRLLGGSDAAKGGDGEEGSPRRQRQDLQGDHS